VTGLPIISKETPGYLFALPMPWPYRVSRSRVVKVMVSARKRHLPYGLLIRRARKYVILLRKAASVVIKQFTHLLSLSADPAPAFKRSKEFVEHILRQNDWLNDGSVTLRVSSFRM